MSPTPVTRDADSASYLEDTPNKEMMAALNRPIPSKFDCSKRVTRGQGTSNEKASVQERKIKSPRRSLRRVTFSDLQKFSKEEATEFIEDENNKPSRNSQRDQLAE
jgi:hypothetical protein